MRRFAAVVVALMMLACPALADTVVSDLGDSYLRSGPGLNYAKLDVLEQGDMAEYLGQMSYDERGVGWYNVLFDGESGWVSSRYTRLETDDGWDWNADALWVRATGGRVYLRSGPGTEYDDVGAIVKGECLRYLDQTRYDESGAAWYKVQNYSYGEAWVSSVYTELTQNYTEATGDDVGTFGSYIRTEGSVNVRSGPGLAWDTLGELGSGVTATYQGNYSVDERGVTWYQIAFEGGSGWVSARYCTLY